MAEWMLWAWRCRRWAKANPSLWVGYMAYLKNCSFGENNLIYPYAKLVNVRLGDFSYVGPETEICNAEIGKFVSIAPGCRIGLGRHPVNYVSTHPALYSRQSEWPQLKCSTFSEFKEYEPVLIGNDVWIGTNAMILDGLSIGNGAIVAAGAVVTKNVPPYAVVGGVPAHVIKYRFAPDEIEKLQQIAWWDWDLQKLTRMQPEFFDLKTFLEAAYETR